MKIVIKQKPWYDMDMPYDSENYKCKAVLSTDEDCTAIDTLKMVVKAMTIEGYMMSTIVQAMYEVSDYLAYENNIEIKKDDEDLTEDFE